MYIADDEIHAQANASDVQYLRIWLKKKLIKERESNTVMHGMYEARIDTHFFYRLKQNITGRKQSKNKVITNETDRKQERERCVER